MDLSYLNAKEETIKAKNELLKACKTIVEKKLVYGTWGNISIRIDDNHFIITPSAKPYDKIQIDGIPIVSINPFTFIGDKPSTEVQLHLNIYKNRSATGAIIHTHSLYASCFAATHKTLPAILDEISQICGPRVLCAKYGKPGTDELVKYTLKALEDRNAAFMANHGSITCGINIDEAILASEILEKGCKVYIKSKTIGRPKKLNYKESAQLFDFYRNVYCKNR